MKTTWFALGLAILATTCTRQHPCREGTVFLTVVFSDDQSLVDGLALSYSFDSVTDHSLFSSDSPLPRPAGKSSGGLELKVDGYAEKRLVLKFAPTKNGQLKGAWRTEAIDLEAGCTAHTLNVAMTEAEKTSKGDGGAPDVPLLLDGSSDERAAKDGVPPEIDIRTMPDATGRDFGRDPDREDNDTRDREDTLTMDTAAQGPDAAQREDSDGGCNPGSPPQSDPSNCGACGKRCSNGDLCSSGHCCPAGSAWCATDGGFGCIDITFNSQNCGSCGRACQVSGTECCKGECKYLQEYAYDTKNCGMCGNVCPKPSDSSEACLVWGDYCLPPTCGPNYKGTTVCNPE